MFIYNYILHGHRIVGTPFTATNWYITSINMIYKRNNASPRWFGTTWGKQRETRRAWLVLTQT